MSLYKKRLNKLQDFLKKTSCDALLVENPIDLYYMTGLTLSAGTLLVYNKDALLAIDGRYYERAKKSSPFPTRLKNKGDSLMTLLENPKLKSIKELAFSTDNTSYERFEQLKKEVTNLTLTPTENPITKLRSLKDPVEIDALRAAAQLGSEGFDFVCTLLKEGISEAEIALELEIFWKRKGGEKTAFDPIIAFGPNSSMPHYSAGNNRLTQGTSALIDIGVTLDHYHSDMTRVVFFGDPNPEILAIYEIVKNAQEKALELCHPGTLIKDLDAAARDFITEQGYGKEFSHSLGHGIGLEVHESPRVSNIAPYAEMALESGMAITIEPGIYLPNVGGVRIEDTIIILDDGYENLTNRPKEPLIINN